MHAQTLENYSLTTKRCGYLKENTVALYNPSVAVVGNFLYTCGGKYEGGGSTEIAMARCFRYDPRFDTWFESAPMNEPRKDFVLVALNKKLYAIAGQDENKVMLSVECYDITNNEWEMKCPLTRHVYMRGRFVWRKSTSPEGRYSQARGENFSAILPSKTHGRKWHQCFKIGKITS